LFQIVGIAARGSARETWDIAREFDVESVALTDVSAAGDQFFPANRGNSVQFFYGAEALTEQAATTEYDLLVNAVSGSAGLESTQAALMRGISVALANKETLVAAGPLIMRTAREHSAQVIPVDSEHSAIFQCMLGEDPAAIRTLWLTTSGGPFWDRPLEELASVTVEETLRHPTWGMGAKITVDSATLFNKGLEVIEAAYLFDVDVEKIAIIAHRQSIVHSMVEFVDGSIKAQLSVPDMCLPILYALTFPQRAASGVVRTAVESLGNLTFQSVPLEKFPCLSLALEAHRRGGTAPAAVSAADEIAVAAFLEGQIGFMDIPRILNQVLHTWPEEPLSDFRQVRRADEAARRMAQAYIRNISGEWKRHRCS